MRADAPLGIILLALGIIFLWALNHGRVQYLGYAITGPPNPANPNQFPAGHPASYPIPGEGSGAVALSLPSYWSDTARQIYTTISAAASRYTPTAIT
jgi:hypothetical protein